MSSHSINSIEKDHSAFVPPPQTQSSPSLFISILRLVQYLISITTLIIGVLAIDRSLVSDRWFSDEGLVIASASIALLVLPVNIYLTLNPSSRRYTILTDTFVSILLVSSVIVIGVYQNQNKGSCLGPAKIGVFDNLRACRKMKSAAALAAVDFVLFAGSAVVGFMKK